MKRRLEWHGMSRDPVYRIWAGMVSRCHGKGSFKYYKDRGIRVCDQWRHSFKRFLADMGPRPSANHSIDRIDSNGNYEPGNCRWATRLIQVLNKRPKKPYTFNGRTMNYVQWAKEVGISKQAMQERLEKWPLERALTAPPNKAAQLAGLGIRTKEQA